MSANYSTWTRSTHRLPDVLVKWVPNPDFVERLTHPNAELRQVKPEFFRGTDHSASGFIAAAGPAVSGRRFIGEIDVLDLAPTFSALIGVPSPERMSGKVIPQFCNLGQAPRT